MTDVRALATRAIPGCPFGGAHTTSPWRTEIGPPHGVSCNRCHQTWVIRDGVLVPTFDEKPK